MWDLEREIVFEDIVYKVVDVLDSVTLLVVRKDDFEAKRFPLQTYIIPGR